MMTVDILSNDIKTTTHPGDSKKTPRQPRRDVGDTCAWRSETTWKFLARHNFQNASDVRHFVFGVAFPVLSSGVCELKCLIYFAIFCLTFRSNNGEPTCRADIFIFVFFLFLVVVV